MLRHAPQDGPDRHHSDPAGRLTTPSRSRLPVTIVCGFLGAGKTTLIRRWLRRKPPPERWVVVLNERGAVSLDDLADEVLSVSAAGGAALAGGVAPAGSVELVDLSAACACCVAEPLLRRQLPRIGAGCDRVIIELSGQGQPQRIADLLRGADLAARFELERIVAVVDAARSTPYRRLDDPSAPALARALAVAQIEAADQVWLRPDDGDDPAGPLEPQGGAGAGGGARGGDTPAGASDASLIETLAAWRPFGRVVRAGIDAFDAHVRFGVEAPRHDPLGARSDGGFADRWLWPAGTRLSRARFVQALRAWPASAPPRARLHAVLATERETYEWRIEGPLSDDKPCVPITIVQRASAYRTCSRIDLHWRDRAVRDWLAGVAAGLAPPAS
ncbi:MAG: GTP-binding protein [Burkholderiaceae bacterium]